MKPLIRGPRFFVTHGRFDTISNVSLGVHHGTYDGTDFILMPAGFPRRAWKLQAGVDVISAGSANSTVTVTLYKNAVHVDNVVLQTTLPVDATGLQGDSRTYTPA